MTHRRRQTRLQCHVSKGLDSQGDALGVPDFSSKRKVAVPEFGAATAMQSVELFAIVNKELFASPPEFETVFEVAVEVSQFLLRNQRRNKWPKFTFRGRRDRYRAYDWDGAQFVEEEQYEEALKKYYKALKLKVEDLVSMATFEQTKGSLLEVAVSINNIAFICQQQKQRFGLEEIAKLYECSLYIKLYVYGAEKHVTVGAAWNNIGAVYFEVENYIRSLHCFRKARQIFRDFFAIDHLDICMVTCNIGDVYYRLGDWTSAVKEYRSSLRLRWILLGPYDKKVMELMHRLANVEMKMARANTNDTAANAEHNDYGDDIDDHSFAAEVNALNVDIKEDLKFFEAALTTAHGEFAKEHMAVFRELQLLRCSTHASEESNQDNSTCLSGDDISLMRADKVALNNCSMVFAGEEAIAVEDSSTSSDWITKHESAVACNKDESLLDVPNSLLDGIDDLKECLNEFEAMCASAETNTQPLDSIAMQKEELSASAASLSCQEKSALISTYSPHSESTGTIDCLDGCKIQHFIEHPEAEIQPTGTVVCGDLQSCGSLETPNSTQEGVIDASVDSVFENVVVSINEKDALVESSFECEQRKFDVMEHSDASGETVADTDTEESSSLQVRAIQRLTNEAVMKDPCNHEFGLVLEMKPVANATVSDTSIKAECSFVARGPNDSEVDNNETCTSGSVSEHIEEKLSPSHYDTPSQHTQPSRMHIKSTIHTNVEFQTQDDWITEEKSTIPGGTTGMLKPKLYESIVVSSKSMPKYSHRVSTDLEKRRMRKHKGRSGLPSKAFTQQQRDDALRDVRTRLEHLRARPKY